MFKWLKKKCLPPPTPPVNWSYLYYQEQRSYALEAARFYYKLSIEFLDKADNHSDPWWIDHYQQCAVNCWSKYKTHKQDLVEIHLEWKKQQNEIIKANSRTNSEENCGKST